MFESKFARFATLLVILAPLWAEPLSASGSPLSADPAAKRVTSTPLTEIFKVELEEGCFSVALSPDAKTLAVGLRDGTIHCYDPSKDAKEVRVLKPKDEDSAQEIKSLVFSPDGKTLLVGGEDGAITLWDIAAGKEKWSFDTKVEIHAVAFAPDGKFTASGNAEGEIVVRAADSGKVRHTLTGEKKDIYALAFSPDSALLASAGVPTEIILWDMKTGKPARKFDNVGPDIKCLAFSRDGGTLVSGNEINGIGVWNVRTGKSIRSLTATDAVLALALLPLAHVNVLITAEGGEIHCRDSEQGQDWRVIECGDDISALTLAPSTRTFAAVSNSRKTSTVLVWRLPLTKYEHLFFEKLDDELRDQLWRDLASEDMFLANGALRVLTSSPDKAVPFLKGRLKLPADPAVSPKLVAELIAKLNNDQFAAREKAMKELERLGQWADKELRAALQEKLPTLEMRRRLERLVAKLDAQIAGKPTPAGLRGQRIASLLETLATDDARSLLREIVDKSSDAIVAAAARSSLERLDKKR